jgi:hypothetical protein
MERRLCEVCGLMKTDRQDGKQPAWGDISAGIIEEYTPNEGTRIGGRGLQSICPACVNKILKFTRTLRKVK